MQELKHELESKLDKQRHALKCIRENITFMEETAQHIYEQINETKREILDIELEMKHAG